MRAVASSVRRRGCGAVVNVSSTAGFTGAPGKVAYAPAKWALRGAAKGAARELAKARSRVNCVLPGLVNTPMARENPPEFNASVVGVRPLNRIGLAVEVARTSFFLVSDESSFAAGAEILVDSGLTAP
jgi:3alpha(or 20beta)-hydroxysteroid dehydrogenase